MRNVKSYTRDSNMAKHAWSSNHPIDLNSQVTGKGSSRIRKTLESCHTSSIDHADNKSCHSLINTLFFEKRTISFFITYIHIFSPVLRYSFYSPTYFFYIIWLSFFPFLSIEGCSLTAESSKVFYN